MINKRGKQKILILLLVLALFLFGCGNKAETDISLEDKVSETIVETEDNPPEVYIDEKTSRETDDEEISEESVPDEVIEEEPLPEQIILDAMSLDEKIWQLMVVTPGQLTNDICVTDTTEYFLECLKIKPVGGILYFGVNLEGPEQTKEMTENALSYGYEVEGIPLFLCIDEEGGRVARIGCREAYGVRRIGPMGKIKDKEEAYEAGTIIGEYLSELGFNFDLAPDADVLTDPDNEAIGDRSFGTDAETVSQFAGAFSDGLHESGVLSCYKHFPGHGGVSGDTHNGFISTEKTLEELLNAELVPFKDAQNNNIDCIMVAHIAAPNVTDDETPASLSYELITDVLRINLGYEGLIMTDALNMSAVNEFSQGEAAVMAIIAGADIVLEPSDIDAAFEGIKSSVEEGQISEERIDESVLRIIRAKLLMTDNNIIN